MIRETTTPALAGESACRSNSRPAIDNPAGLLHPRIEEDYFVTRLQKLRIDARASLSPTIKRRQYFEGWLHHSRLESDGRARCNAARQYWSHDDDGVPRNHPYSLSPSVQLTVLDHLGAIY